MRELRRTVRGSFVLLFILALSGARLPALEELTAQQLGDLAPHLLKLHLNQPRFDAELMRRVVKEFLELVDPTHTVYLQSEAEEKLKLSDDVLNDQARNIALGRLDFFTDWVRELKEKYLARDAEFFKGLPERKDELKAKIEKAETEKIKFKERAATPEERLRRIVLIANRDYELNREFLTEEEALRFAVQIVATQREKWKAFEIERDTPKTVMKAIMTALDPHSEYMDAEDVEQFETSMARSFAGIGVHIRGCPSGAQVVEVIKGGPVSKDGSIGPFDQIIAVEGEVVAQQELPKIVRRIKGEKGTPVKLTVKKAKKDNETESKIVVVTLIRDTIDLSELRVTGKKVDAPYGAGGPIGVISVESFYQGVAGDVAERIAQLGTPAPLAGLVLDLRGNSGGLLDEAVKLAGLFIGEGPIVAERDSNNITRWRLDPDENTVYAGPLVVLVSQFSASASEIVAGTLQDYGRAILVGATQTHGKGTVQRVIDLAQIPMPGRVRMTFQQYFLAGGHSVQLDGVLPDILIPGSKLYEDYLERANTNVIPAGKIQGRISPDHPDFKKYATWKKENLTILTEQSRKRVEANKDFDVFRNPNAEEGANLEDHRFPKDPEVLKDPKDPPADPANKENKPSRRKKDGFDPQMDEAVLIVQDETTLWPKSSFVARTGEKIGQPRNSADPNAARTGERAP